VKLRHRLHRLEQQLPDPGCPACRGRPAEVKVVTTRIYIPDNDRGDTTRRPREERGDPNPCPVCGWQPVIVEVGEVVIVGGWDFTDYELRYESEGAT